MLGLPTGARFREDVSPAQLAAPSSRSRFPEVFGHQLSRTTPGLRAARLYGWVSTYSDGRRFCRGRGVPHSCRFRYGLGQLMAGCCPGALFCLGFYGKISRVSPRRRGVRTLGRGRRRLSRACGHVVLEEGMAVRAVGEVDVEDHRVVDCLPHAVADDLLVVLVMEKTGFIGAR